MKQTKSYSSALTLKQKRISIDKLNAYKAYVDFSKYIKNCWPTLKTITVSALDLTQTKFHYTQPKTCIKYLIKWKVIANSTKSLPIRSSK